MESPVNLGRFRRATESDLEIAHGYLLQVLMEQIEKYRQGKVIDHRTGEPKLVPTSLLTELSRMLKNNGVDRPGREDDGEDLLADDLDEFMSSYRDQLKGFPESDEEEQITPSQATHDQAEQRMSAIERQLSASCYACGEFKPREAFAKNRARANGLQNKCKECMAKEYAEKKAKKQSNPIHLRLRSSI